MSADPVEPRPAASVALVRGVAGPAPIETYLIRRHRGMRFLGGFYAFPGGKVDPGDAARDSLARCAGLTPDDAEAVFPGGLLPALAYWFTAVRELLEETGVLLACDASGRPVGADEAARVDGMRAALAEGSAPLERLLAAEGWFADLRPLRYVAHFITPKASPIRYTARFFLCPVPAGQAPRLVTSEATEGFWMDAAEGYRRFRAGDMAMAEPAEYTLAYLAQFESLEAVWAAHADGRHKFHGIVDRIDGFWQGFDWDAARFRS